MLTKGSKLMMLLLYLIWRIRTYYVKKNCYRNQLIGVDVDDEGEEELREQQDDGSFRDPLPDEWGRPDKASMVVHGGYHSQWEYDTNMIRVKQVFWNKSALK